MTISGLKLKDTYDGKYVLAPSGQQTSAKATIARKSLKNAEITLTKASSAYTGKSQAGAVKAVKLGSTTLKASRDFTAKAKSGKDVGSYQVTLTGCGNYTGAASATCKITRAKPALSATTKKAVTVAAAKARKQTLKLAVKSKSKGALSYKVVKANKRITFKKGVATLKKGAYKKGKQSLTVKVTQAAKGNYAKASKTLTLAFVVK